MIDVEKYWDRVDSDRFRRVRELSEIRRFCGSSPVADPESVGSRAAVVLCYAAWEGFYNECISNYLSFMKALGGKVRDTNWVLLLGAIGADLDSLRDRHHSDDARLKFVQRLEALVDSKFDDVDSKHLGRRSIVNFDRVRYGYSIFGFDLMPLQRHRLRLDRELVAWRNSVAHGVAPDLTTLDISRHVHFTRELLITVSDDFQNGMLRYFR